MKFESILNPFFTVNPLQSTDVHFFVKLVSRNIKAKNHKS